MIATSEAFYVFKLTYMSQACDCSMNNLQLASVSDSTAGGIKYMEEIVHDQDQYILCGPIYDTLFRKQYNTFTLFSVGILFTLLLA